MNAAPKPVPSMAISDAEERLRLSRNDVEALAAIADHRLLENDHRAASAYYRAALHNLMSVGRGNGTLASRVHEMIVWLDQMYLNHIRNYLEESGFSQADWHPRFAKSIAMMLGQLERPQEPHRYPQMPLSFYYSGMEHHEFVPNDQFSWVENLESKTEEIVQEARSLLESSDNFGAYLRTTHDRPQGDVHGMLENSGWSSFELAKKGKFEPDRVAFCPKTYTALKQIPLCQIENRAPTPMFSLLRAGERIPPHTGMINVRYVCHLPLIVPGDGALRVGTTTRNWEAGQVMIFDDSVEHEAYNNSPKDRLVLIFDIWRPDLEQVERDQICALFAAVDSY